MNAKHYQINRAEMAAKALEGEVLIINLHNGTYYSMGGSAALPWVMLEQGCSVGQCVRAMAQNWKVGVEQVEADLVALLQQLVEEHILTPVAAAGPEPDFQISDHPDSLGEPPDRYSRPLLTIFDDMGDLLALDPPMPKVSIS